MHECAGSVWVLQVPEANQRVSEAFLRREGDLIERRGCASVQGLDVSGGVPPG